MNYQKIYNSLMLKARNRVLEEKYSENHHIIPKCFGGPNDSSNLVELLPREHFIAHRLLWRLQTEKRKKFQMLKAITMMSGKAVYNSKVYDHLRREYGKIISKNISGSNHPRFGLRGEQCPTFGLRFNLSEEAITKIKKAKKGMVSALDLRTLEKKWVPVELFKKHNYYVGHTHGSKGAIKNKIAVFKEKTVFIHKDELELFKSNGFSLGEKPKKIISCELCGFRLTAPNLARHQNGKNCSGQRRI